jgi:hypothetical protein
MFLMHSYLLCTTRPVSSTCSELRYIPCYLVIVSVCVPYAISTYPLVRCILSTLRRAIIDC